MTYRELLVVLNRMSENELDRHAIVTPDRDPNDMSTYRIVSKVVITECSNPLIENQIVLSTFN